MYKITKVTRTYKGSCTVTREHTVTSNGTMIDVDHVLSLPEKEPGDREEARDELNETGITCYRGYMIEEI